MSQFSDFVADLTFNPKQAESFADLMVEQAYQEPAISELHTVVPNIKSQQIIPYIGRFSKITKLDPGCGEGKTSKPIPASEKMWDPVKTKAWLAECADDLEQTFLVWQLPGGEDRTTLGDQIISFLGSRFAEAQAEDALRQAWLADTAIAAGDLTGGAGDVENYNLFDGLWKQLVAIGTANPSQRVTISQNAELTSAAQLTLPDDFAVNLFREMFEKADSRLRNDPNARFHVTEEIFFNYMSWLETAQGVSESWLRIENGVTSLRYRGKWVYNMDFLTRYIQSDFLVGGAYDTPHRAVLTNKANLVLGYDLPSAVGGAPRVWYNLDTEEVNMRNKYKVDAKIGWDHMVQLAY